jgi:hypothetical protein
MNLERKKEMLRQFQMFSSRISTQYDRVYTLLDEGNYIEADRILAALAQSHAKTSVSLHNLCIKEGLIPE